MGDNSELYLEKKFVREVYDNIAEHFSETRYKPWPGITEFLETRSPGEMGADIGCGNGKYLLAMQKNENISSKNLCPVLACDFSENLATIVQNRGFDVIVADNTRLPYRAGVLDFFISVAVIHHLGSKERRIQALCEMCNLLRIGGEGIIQVWALEQNRNGVNSLYVKKTEENDEESFLETCEGQKLPIHKGGRNFKHQDLLIPFKSKTAETNDVNKTARYYHLFVEGELEELCEQVSGIKVVKSFYEQGNWSVVIQKIM